MFTNALVHPHDITVLIRDTEAHERALFTNAPAEPSAIGASKTKTRKSVAYGLSPSKERLKGRISSHGGSTRTAAVRMLLGGDVLDQLRKGGASGGRDRGDVNVDVLLTGAEKLCKGAAEKVSTLRTRYEQLSSSIARYETRVAKQALQLDQMNHPKEYTEDLNADDNEDKVVVEPTIQRHVRANAEDIKREEEELRELEKKKRGLEDRVSGMDRDLGGLMR
ncbi:MAG: hypothetical protein Q9187_001373 [Circinaria calcarea]